MEKWSGVILWRPLIIARLKHEKRTGLEKIGVF